MQDHLLIMVSARFSPHKDYFLARFPSPFPIDNVWNMYYRRFRSRIICDPRPPKQNVRKFSARCKSSICKTVEQARACSMQLVRIHEQGFRIRERQPRRHRL